MADSPTRSMPGVPAVLAIGGSDSCGGAGIQADLKVLTVFGVYGATAITAITAQNTTGLKGCWPLDPALVEKQIDAVAGDMVLKATKVGMLANAAVAKAVVASVRRNKLFPLVVDPVMFNKHGDVLTDSAATTVIAQSLLREAALVTPNRKEAARLLGESKSIDDLGQGAAAARRICKQFGVGACLIKGFRRPGAGGVDEAVDVFCIGQDVQELVGEWRLSTSTHGAGTSLAAAVVAGLALGQDLKTAVLNAKRYVVEAIRQATDLGAGTSPVNHIAGMKVK